jgi:hypothetical protein
MWARDYVGLGRFLLIHGGFLTRIHITCQQCHASEHATLHSGIAKWVQLPEGWLVLLECLDLVVRCPKCVPK